ncbi:MAG TPA: hypothetical protein VNJ08_02570 [Bacteriovoracaceae bacterium]|nr:hypothetical protein [Bacteriovoracaceae bacterium]
MSSVPIIKLGFSTDWKVLADSIDKNSDYEAMDLISANETANYLSTVNSALVFTSLAKKDDLILIATLMKFYKKIAPDTAVKIVVVSFSTDKEFDNATAKLGIQDVIDPNISVKALKFKIEFWMRALRVQAKKNEAVIAAKAAAKAAEQARAAEKKALDASPSLRWEAPLDCTDDFWIIKYESDCKLVLGKWLIRLMGPSPCIGTWAEVSGKSNVWKFEVRPEERKFFLQGDGNWFFRGDQKPDFVWIENTWMITGTSFELFYQSSKKTLSKLSLKNKQVLFCKNSEYALAKEQLIVESFEKEMIFKNENGHLNTNEEVDTEGGTDKFKNLQGKGKTENISSDLLSGKSKGEKDLGRGFMDLTLDPHDDEGSSELSMENKDNHHQTHYKNNTKGEKDEGTGRGPLSYKREKEEQGPDSAPTAEGARKGALLDQGNKNNEHKTHYKGHNEAEKFERSEELGRKGYSSDKLSDYKGRAEYGKNPQEDAKNGKTSTDKINNYYKKGDFEKSPENAGDVKSEDIRNRKAVQLKEPSSPQNYLSEVEIERENKKAKKEAFVARERALQEREKNAETPKDSKRARKEEHEAREKTSRERDEKANLEKSIREHAELEEQKLTRKKASEVEKEKNKSDDNVESLREKNKEKGNFSDEVGGNLQGKSRTEKLEAYYRKRELSQQGLENDDDSDEVEPVVGGPKKKTLPQREKLTRILNRPGTRSDKDEDEPKLKTPERKLGLKSAGKNKHYEDDKSPDEDSNVASLDEAREARDNAREIESLDEFEDETSESQVSESTEETAGSRKNEKFRGAFKEKADESAHDASMAKAKDFILPNESNKDLAKAKTKPSEGSQGNLAKASAKAKEGSQDLDEDNQEISKAKVKGTLIDKARAKSNEGSQDPADENEDSLEVLTENTLENENKTESEIEEEAERALEEACESAQVLSYLIQDRIKISCQLDDFFDQTISFVTSESGITAAAHVNLDLSFTYLKDDIRAKFRGVVTKIDQDEDGTSYITVKLGKSSMPEFDAFVKLYKKRQGNVDFFLQKVKGYA